MYPVAAIGAAPSTNQASVSSSSTAVQIVTAASGNNSRRASAAGIVVKALSTNTKSVYVGASGVTSSNGFELAAKDSITLPIDDPSRIYIIGGDSTTVSVCFIYL